MSVFTRSCCCLQIDLLPNDSAIKAVESNIRAHNSEVDIMRTTHCSLDISQILNKGAFAGSRQQPSQLQQLQNPSATTQPLSSAQRIAAPAHDIHVDKAPETHLQSHDAQQPGEHSQSSVAQFWQQEPQAVSSREHGSDAGHGSHGHSHDHAHSHAGHLSSVRSINLIHQGQVDLAR